MKTNCAGSERKVKLYVSISVRVIIAAYGCYRSNPKCYYCKDFISR